MDKIAIIIVHYNTDEDTTEALRSLVRLENPGLQIRTFVVDNASKTPYVLPKKVGDVQLLRSDTNLGFTGGNNLGFTTASKSFNPDYFLLLNSDTLVKPSFVQLLYLALQKHKDWGVAVPKMYFAPGCEFYHGDYESRQQGRVIWFAGGSIDWDNLLTIHRGVDEVDCGQFEAETTLDFATGCCFLVRREVLATAGDFDDRYFLYYEDTDLSQRIVKNNFKIGFVPDSIIWHKNGGSTQGSGSDLQSFYQTRNRLLFFFEHGDWLVRQRVIRLAWRLWRHGSPVEKLAATKFLLGRFGKQLAI